MHFRNDCISVKSEWGFFGGVVCVRHKYFSFFSRFSTFYSDSHKATGRPRNVYFVLYFCWRKFYIADSLANV